MIAEKLVSALALAAVISGPASAVTINWTLENVTFDDGGTASGRFNTVTSHDANNDPRFVHHWDIGTTAGSTLNGAVYTPATGFFAYALTDFYEPNSIVFQIQPFVGNPYILLAFANPLTSAGVDTLSTSSYECQNCNPYRYVTGGYAVGAVAVPEPADWLFLFAGFAVVGTAARSRRKIAAF